MRNQKTQCAMYRPYHGVLVRQLIATNNPGLSRTNVGIIRSVDTSDTDIVTGAPQWLINLQSTIRGDLR
jgi:hypothetical protein